jgi:hypothetical protein|nr:MAG TPA: KTSC domain [Herelleviridae sp.]
MATITISVHSSFIKSAMYNEDKQSLRIEIGNSWYYYYGVTKQKVSHFKKAASKGQYFCNYIKGRYRTIKRTAR